MLGLRVNIALANEMVKQDKVLLFSKWLAFKYLKRNSVIYDYTPKKLAKLYNEEYNDALSERTVRNNINKFEQLNWIERTKNGHIKFKRQGDIANDLDLIKLGYYEIVANSKKLLNYKIIRISLYKEIFIRKIEQQNLLLTAHSNQAESVMKKAEKAFGSDKMNQGVDEIDNVFNISYEGLAELWNTSKSNAFKIMKEMINRDMINKLRRVKKVCKGNFAKQFNKAVDKGFFFAGLTYTFVVYTNEYYF